jgi:predicted O-linked N-acetylglucosamine transferase (SPINDLY family)
MPLLTPQQAFSLAMDYYRAGQFAEAEALFRQLLASDPDNVDLMHLLGIVARATGRYPEAIEWMQRAIAAGPNVAYYRNNYGLLLADCGRYEESAAEFEIARQLDPSDADIPYNLGNTRNRLNQSDSAISAYQAALQLNPQHVKAWINLGLVLNAVNRSEEAIAAYQAARRACPSEAALALNLAILYQEQGRLDEAVVAYQDGLALAPDSYVAHNNFALLLKDRGEVAESVRTLRRSLALNTNAEVQSNLIFTLQFDPETSPETVQTEEQIWNARFATPLRSERLPHFNDRSPERRLRIGYVSADLRNHVVGRTLLPIFEAHDPAQVECVCYGGPIADEVSKRFRDGAALWRDMELWSDDQLAAQVQEDRIDILVDLGLHTAYNRLCAFARAPAPIQVSWLGYPGGTGVETIDHWISDRFLSPPASAPSEKAGHPFRMPHAWCCYPAPETSPEVNSLPAASTGQITFGCFNNFSKVNDRVLQLWSRILHAVPGSRLRLLTKAGAHRDRAASVMSQQGIDRQRLVFLGYEPPSPNQGASHYLQRYHQIDIALDPFPYNGMTTTCDALWMGVPVIALRGTLPIGRASFSILSNIGLPEYAAQSEDEYVQQAVSLANGHRRLAELRSTLRSRMMASPLLDAPLFARNLEAAFREMWREWCLTHG